MKIDASTVLTGLAGWPVSHSRSPSIHNYWFDAHGINGAYLALPVASEHFTEAVRGLQATGFRGLNITVPHKEAAAALADARHDSVTRIGAANVLTFAPDGTISAANTDKAGFLHSLRSGAPGWDAAVGPAVVLGAGGAARAVICALVDTGVETIRIVNRSPGRARQLQAQFGGKFEIYDWEKASDALHDATLLVNATTLGMESQPPLVLALEALPQNAVVNDLVYAPLETRLLRTARQRGLVTIDGLGMLLHQAAAAFALWFGVEPVVDEALRRFVVDG